jgi:hypothetical protein
MLSGHLHAPACLLRGKESAIPRAQRPSGQSSGYEKSSCPRQHILNLALLTRISCVHYLQIPFSVARTCKESYGNDVHWSKGEVSQPLK